MKSRVCVLLTTRLIQPVMDAAFLDRLARQLRTDKTPSCRRAINRILEYMKKRCDDGQYETPMATESDFREFVEKERACEKAVK